MDLFAAFVRPAIEFNIFQSEAPVTVVSLEVSRPRSMRAIEFYAEREINRRSDITVELYLNRENVSFKHTGCQVTLAAEAWNSGRS